MMYERLAAFLVEHLDFSMVSTILEAGCGSGQLTVPLAAKVRQINPDIRVVALDLCAGPYRGHLDLLRARVREERLESVIAPVRADARSMAVVGDGSVDLAISNETLCELDRQGLAMALREFHRVLRSGGQMVHSELIPAFENDAQRLVIAANQHSEATSAPSPEWFSPCSDEVAALLHTIGFTDITVRYFETNVRFSRFEVALERLRQWHVDPAFVKEHLEEVERCGLEYPMEHVIFCRKQ
jgi:ubiquinone/menaquinone biosynthesis C-methylase UbiE